jgi:hypothetical protein
MPIHKRDRNFQKIVNELEIKSVPTEFVQQLTLVCENGDEIIFDEDTIKIYQEETDFITALIKLVEDNDDLQSKIIDVEIVINYKKLEENIGKLTKELLDAKSK